MTAGYSFANRAAIANIDTNLLLSLDGFVVYSIATYEEFMLDLNAVSGDITPNGGAPGFWILLNGAVGDMLKATYDPADNGYVDLAAAIVGASAASNNQFYGKDGTGTLGFHTVVGGGSGNAGTIEDNGSNINVETLAANKTLTVTDEVTQRLDPDASPRLVTLATPSDNHKVIIEHDGQAGSLTVTDGSSNFSVLNTNLFEPFKVEASFKDLAWYFTEYQRVPSFPKITNTGIIQIGDAAATNFVINHPFNTTNYDVLVWENATGEEVKVTTQLNLKSVVLDFGAVVPTLNQYSMVAFRLDTLGLKTLDIIGDGVTTDYFINHFEGDDIFMTAHELTNTRELILPTEFIRNTSSQSQINITPAPSVGVNIRFLTYLFNPPAQSFFAQDIGDGVATSIQVTHNLASLATKVVLYDLDNNFEDVIVDNTRDDTNNITLDFPVAPTLNQYRAMFFNTLAA